MQLSICLWQVVNNKVAIMVCKYWDHLFIRWSFMTRLDKLIELVKSSQLVTKKFQTKGFWWEVRKQKLIKSPKNQTKGIWQKMKKLKNERKLEGQSFVTIDRACNLQLTTPILPSFLVLTIFKNFFFHVIASKLKQ